MSRIVAFRQKHGGQLAPCHQPYVAPLQDPRIKSLRSTNIVCHGQGGIRRPILLKILKNLAGGRRAIRFPNVRLCLLVKDEQNVIARSTLLCFANCKTVSTGVAVLSRLYRMFIRGFVWMVQNLCAYSRTDYEDVYFSRFVVVNNPFTGSYTHKIALDKMHEANQIFVKHSEKFKGYAVRFGAVSTSVFPCGTFTVAGARNMKQANATITNALKLYEPHVIRDE